MNKKFLFNTVLFAGAAMFAACDYNEDNFDGLSDGAVPSDVKKVEYTMTAADYKAVSTNKANVALAGDSLKKALGDVAKHEAFSDDIPAATYMPAFLSQKYFTADEGSAVKVTYDKDLKWSDDMKQLNTASTYKVSTSDYEQVWGKPVNFFSPMEKPSKHLPAILGVEYADAAAGEMVLVDYQMSDSEPAGEVVPVLNEPFDGYWEGTKMEPLAIPGWLNVTTKGEKSWIGGNFNGENNYVETSAFKAEGEVENYLIVPAFKVEEGMEFSFDACYNHNNDKGSYLTVLLLATNDDLSTYSAEQIASAKWTDISDALNIPMPDGKYGTLANVYTKDLSAFVGKRVYVAFRYNGDATKGATATVRMDNILIKGGTAAEVEPVVTAQTDMYEFNGETWKEYTEAYVLADADYAEMKLSHNNFSDKDKADNYLPQFLAAKYPYAQEGDKQTVAYKFYRKEVTSVRADEYVFTAGVWNKAPKTETITDQFVLSNGKWNYDPSTVIELSPVKNETSILYYQTATDWVWENIDVPAGATKKGEGYVSHYGNNEYYSGCSAHFCNVDMRADKARGQYAKGYEGMTDEEVVEAMEKHLVEVMKATLETLHKDVAPIAGIEVIFTIKMGVYTGIQLSNCNYEMKYKVVGPGTFEYVEDSYKPLAE